MRVVKECPVGHEDVDFVDYGTRWFVFCYKCQKKYCEKDYKNLEVLKDE